MRNLIYLFLSFFIMCGINSCKAQKLNTKELSSNFDMNYVLARIFPNSLVSKQLYKDSQFLTIFKISDSKITPENYSEGDEFLISYFISVAPDGDSYTNSKLYKIEGLINPKITEIKETTFPNFSIKIEHGSYDKRKVENLNFKGVNQ